MFVCLTGVCTERCCSSRWQRWAKTTSVRHTLVPADHNPALRTSIKVTFPLSLQLLLIKSIRRRTRGSAPRWAGTSSGGSERSLLVPKLWTADVASIRRSSAEASGDRAPDPWWTRCTPKPKAASADSGTVEGEEWDLMVTFLCFVVLAAVTRSDFPSSPPRKRFF